MNKVSIAIGNLKYILENLCLSLRTLQKSLRLNFLECKLAWVLFDVGHSDLVDADQVVGRLKVPHPLLRRPERAGGLRALPIQRI